jgi:diaminopimelate epimerase
VEKRGNRRFTVETADGAVSCEVSHGGKSVTVEMAEMSFDSKGIRLQVNLVKY